MFLVFFFFLNLYILLVFLKMLFFLDGSLSTMYDFWCICFIFLKFQSNIYSRYLHKPFDTSQNLSQWIEF